MKKRISLSAAILPLLLLLLTACSLPKIIVLHDPLSAEEHVRLGSIYETQGRTDLARDQYRAATDLDRKHIKAWILYGDLSYRTGEYAEAEKAYRKALDLDPGNGDLYNNLAWVGVQQAKDLPRAEERVRKALELKPANRPYYLDTLGVLLLKLGRTGEAVTALQESVATIPADRTDLLAEAYGHLAEAYRSAGDEARANEALERSEQLKKGP